MKNTFVGQIREGMEVRSVDGHKLGKVVAIQTDAFVIEKGVLFPKDYTISIDTIDDVRENTIVLSRRRDELGIEKGILETLGLAGQEPLHAALRLEEAERAEEAARLSLHEEEVQATTHAEQVGEVRIRKDVVTEERQFTVPVTREVVTVERVPVAAGNARASATAEGTAFREESIVVPVREEVVDIRKRPVVTEEIVVTRATEETTAPVSTTVRREVAEIVSEGELEATEAPLRKTGT